MEASKRIIGSLFRPTVLSLVIFVSLAMAINLMAMSAAQAAASQPPPAKNIIIMIGNGMGFNHLEAASYYQYGKNAKQIYTKFPFSYAMSTYMAYDISDSCYGHGYDPSLAWSDFDYVTDCPGDSPAAATAMSTGVKTYQNAIGVDLMQQPLIHALELAEQKGKATGVVTSVELSQATPAAFVAHNVSRNNYKQIAQEMVYDSAVDVIMGCGHPFYDSDGEPYDDQNLITFEYVGGEDTWWELVAGIAGGDADGDGVDDWWIHIDERAQFQSLATGPTPKRVFGIAPVYQTLQQGRGGDVHADPYLVPLIDSVPTLVEMTEAALNILDDDPDGLFLMVAGGAIDRASHANQSGRMIEEQIDFDKAVEAAVAWVKNKSSWGETLLIVTSTHEAGYLTGPNSDPILKPIVNNGAGNLPGMEWHSSSHTNSLVPVFAKGSMGRELKSYTDEYDPIRGPYADNTEIAMVIFSAIGP